MDENFIERAEANVASEIAAGIARARLRESPPPGFGGICECGDQIPEQRLGFGYHRCVPCQTTREKKWGRGL